jgi:Flp pilus assembly pilin Flp
LIPAPKWDVMTLEVHVQQIVRALWRDNDGQDIIEYTLLIAFIVVAATAVLGFNTASIRAIATVNNSQLEAAAKVATS